MTFAIIQNGIVVNIVKAEQADAKDPNYLWVDITDVDPMPGIRWTYDAGEFTNPEQPVVITPQQKIEGKISDHVDGFNKLFVTYMAQNILLDLVVSGKSKLIADALADAIRYGNLGLLDQANKALLIIQVTPDMDPFITADKISSMVKDITNLRDS